MFLTPGNWMLMMWISGPHYVDAPAPETPTRAFDPLNYPVALDDDGNLTPLGLIRAEFRLNPQVRLRLTALLQNNGLNLC